MTNKDKMNPLAKQLWIDALTNGSHTQVCGFMRRESTKNAEVKNMCVMGVLADVALKYSGLEYTNQNWLEFADLGWPTERTLKWAKLNRPQVRKLINFNDAKGSAHKTFPEFAEYIKENL